MITPKGTTQNFVDDLHKHGGITDALEYGLQSEEYNLPSAVARGWNDLRAAYAAYVTVKQYFTDAVERAGLDIGDE
jgi:hypothetical protein